jgi:hypothetical protein
MSASVSRRQPNSNPCTPGIKNAHPATQNDALPHHDATTLR